MEKIEILANELAMLSNQSIMRLAQKLVEDYPQRADVLETQLGSAFFDNDIAFGGDITNG
jgi:hypothetical protein